MLSITPEPLKVLRELYRVLRPGGCCPLLCVGYYNAVFHSLLEGLDRYQAFLEDPVLDIKGLGFRTYKPKEIRQAIRSCWV